MSANRPYEDARTRVDERGAALLIVLITVALIGTVFGALLNYQSTTLKAQTILSAQRSENLGADAAIDAAIAQLQVTRTNGKSGAATGCNSTTLGTFITWHDPTAGDIVVSCQTTSGTSGTGANPRQVHLSASPPGSTADVTLYDPPSASSPVVVSISNWNRTE